MILDQVLLYEAVPPPGERSPKPLSPRPLPLPAVGDIGELGPRRGEEAEPRPREEEPEPRPPGDEPGPSGDEVEPGPRRVGVAGALVMEPERRVPGYCQKRPNRDHRVRNYHYRRAKSADQRESNLGQPTSLRFLHQSASSK